MDQQARLLAQGLPHCRVGVAQAAYGDAGQGIQVASAIGVPEPSPFAAGEGHG